MNFKNYSGIKFIAKGKHNILYKIKIYEKEDYYKGRDVKEVWYKPFRVYGQWKEFKISFKEMVIEEYWEQEYISDNIQAFTNIAGVSITAQNLSSKEPVKGRIFLDNIELY